MLSIGQLYQGLIVFWTTYFGVSWFFPTDQVISRPNAKITHEKVVNRLTQHCFVTALMIPILSYIPPILAFSSGWTAYLSKFILLPLIAELWFYYMHRLMHHRFFYRWHADHHAFIQPYAFAGLYCSPVEMVLINQMTIALPCQLLGLSLIEIMLFSIVVALNVLKGHAALHLRKDVPKWIPSILTQSWDHDIHHKIMVGNYGVLYLLDRVHGTYIETSSYYKPDTEQLQESS
jgi:sterol desaturase/sphingolipid hydroxylase (fatty acid hydroxylase superfamily)